MKIFSSEQIRLWDAFTITNEPVPSIDLMERAAKKCFDVITTKYAQKKFAVFCGPGNNGGDGLAIARMLIQNGLLVKVYLVSGKEGSPDFNTNLHRLEAITTVEVINENSTPDISDSVVVDAIFGNGLNKKISGSIEKIIQHINSTAKEIISIDIPSGMFADTSSKGNAIINAKLTLTFQTKKLAFYMPENASHLGNVLVLDIGLHPQFYERTETSFREIDSTLIRNIYRPRAPFTHKGTYGNACLVAGSYGMMGAAVLAAQGCIRSGAGKLTCITCEEGYTILQITTPESMCRISGKGHISGKIDFSGFDAVGIGPGIGKFDSHKDLLEKAFDTIKMPMIIDADALNILSDHPEFYKKIQRNSILTPHPKEFERLFGKTNNDFEQRQLALKKAKEYSIHIILKGKYTFVATPDGKGYFNTTGNPGMATGGSGDVLTGILTGLMAQQYSPLDSCMLGVYLHGHAGDIAKKDLSEAALIASDLCKYLGKAFLSLSNESLTNERAYS